MNQRNAQGQTPLAVAQLNKQEAAHSGGSWRMERSEVLLQSWRRPPFNFLQPTVHRHNVDEQVS